MIPVSIEFSMSFMTTTFMMIKLFGLFELIVYDPINYIIGLSILQNPGHVSL